MPEIAFTFDEHRHAYLRTADGLRVPSVTQVLTRTGWANYDEVQSDILERASARGTAVHAITEFIDLEMGDVPAEEVDLSPVAAEYVPYVQAWLKFKHESKVQILSVEQQAICEINGMPIGRKFDRLAMVNGRESILEVKTGESKYEWWGLQLSAYDLTLPQCAAQLHRDRYAVQLMKSGNYRMHPFTDEGDYDGFKWALAVTWQQLNRGYKLD